jgi:hypothetical protein
MGPDRVAEIRCLLAEAALRAFDRDGGGRLPGDLVAVLQADALASPQTAARCPALLRAAGPQVTEYVQVTAECVTGLDSTEEDQGQLARVGGSRWMRPTEAARLLGLGIPAVRAACRRGDLVAVRREYGWRIDPASVARFGRRHGRQHPSETSGQAGAA